MTSHAIMMAAALIFLLATATGLAAAPSKVEIDSDGMLKIAGERTLVLGIYNAPEPGVGLGEIAEAGFNLVHSERSVEALDALAAHHLFGWIPLGSHELDLAQDAVQRRAALQKAVAPLKDHPALLVWEGPDEVLWNIYYPGSSAGAAAKAHAAAQGLLEGYHALRQLDPAHPLWFNHAPRNGIAALAEFNRACDICGCDIYPVPEYRTGHSDLRDRSLASVGAYTERMKQAGEGKPVWMVLQGFGWWDIRPAAEQAKHPEQKDEGRRPRFNETRFMAYDALVHGATGLLYWGTRYIEPDSGFWAELKMVVKELATLRPVLESPTLAWKPTAEVIEDGNSRERGLPIMVKRHAGALYLVIVNEEEERTEFVLRGMDAYEGVAFHSLFDGGSLKVEEGALRAAVGGHTVEIYTNGAGFDEKVRALPRPAAK